MVVINPWCGCIERDVYIYIYVFISKDIPPWCKMGYPLLETNTSPVKITILSFGKDLFSGAMLVLRRVS